MGAGITGMVGGATGGAIQMGVDAHVRNQNWSRQKRVLQERYQWMVRDLRAAGLNPILAATGGFGGPGGTPQLAGPSGNFGQAVASGIQAGTGASKAKSEISKNAALKNAANAQTLKLNEEALNQREMRPLIRAQAEKMAFDAQSSALQVQRMGFEIPRMKAIAEMWETPFIKQMMQSKEFLQGTPMFRWDPNRGPRPKAKKPPAGTRRIDPKSQRKRWK